MKPHEPGLFGAEYDRASRQLPVIGEQKDIRYYSSPAKSVLNGPETTGMGFWSINPYIGCAFGCAYCYARYTHRYVMERAASDERMTKELGAAYNNLPPWLAFERNIFVKRNAPEVLSRTLRFGSDRHLKLLEGEKAINAVSLGYAEATDNLQEYERTNRVLIGILIQVADAQKTLINTQAELDRQRAVARLAPRSEERRVGKECRSRWSPYH